MDGEFPVERIEMKYYGRTPKGKKYHYGTTVIPYVGDTRSFRVWTVCGAEMISDDTTMDIDQRFEFCKRCFFVLAWEALMRDLSAQAEEAKRLTGKPGRRKSGGGR